MKIAEILVAAKALIDTPEKHTVEVSARDKHGISVPPMNKNAVCFCVLGAINRVTNGKPFAEAAFDSKCIFKEANGIDGVAKFNDTHTHPEIMKAFDKAIDYAQQRGV